MLTLILKVTTACNLRCYYCSVGEKIETERMSYERMLASLQWAASYAEGEGESKIHVIFHGGEPMLLDPNQYDRGIRAIQRRAPQISWTFSVQTNGTILTTDYLELFREHNIHVGVSLDGSKGIHDGQRCTADGGGTYDLVCHHIEQMQAAGVSVAALMVLTRPALDRPLDFLTCFHQKDIPLKINPLLQVGEAVKHLELALKPGEYGAYLTRVFRFLAAENLELPVSPLGDLLTALLRGETPHGCSYDGQCSQRFLCIDPYGTIYPCGRFSDSDLFPLGTVEEGITEVGQKHMAELLACRTSKLPEECQTCKEKQFCHGGCSASVLTEASGRNPLCQDTKQLMNFLRTDGLDLLRKQLLAEKARLQRQCEQETSHGI